jgi:hypothetical protein
LPPVFILKDGEKRILIWPNPPAIMTSLPTFCPKDFWKAIVEKFCIHGNQHPEIPFNDEAKTHLTREEIHQGAA